MRIIEADAMGMCFGVRDALEAARGVERPVEMTVFGELVHNPEVTGELHRRGFALLREEERTVKNVHTPRVMITAHGVSERERARLVASGKELLDTTCPLVNKAHKAARALARAGFFVVVAGRRGHVEIAGITGDLDAGGFVVVERPGEVVFYGARRIAVMAQTTSVEPEVRAIVEMVRVMNPASEVRFVNTICRPTRERQAALERLIEKVTVLVVVGGRHSNNTRQLAARGREAGRRVIHLEAAAELRPGMFSGSDTVGMTAGTSTPEETIQAVRDRLASLAADVMVSSPVRGPVMRVA